MGSQRQSAMGEAWILGSASLVRTGRLVTAAALLFSVAVGAFITSELVFVKELSVGLVSAVLLDATIVRALLVPALMRLLGEANWWSPHWARRRTEPVPPAREPDLSTTPYSRESA